MVVAMENASLMLRLDQRLEELAGLAFLHYGVEVKKPEVTFDLRGTQAGVVTYYDYTAHFNPILFAENPEEFLIDTVGHEFGHLAVRKLHPKANFKHGRQWQEVLRTLGVPINIDHRFSVRTILEATPGTVDFLENDNLSICPDILDREGQVYERYRVGLAQPR